MSLKQKNIILLVGFIVLLWITYQFSISKTLEARSTYNTLSRQKEAISNIPQQVNYLKQQNTHYDSLLEKNKISAESSFQNNLLQTINSFATNNNLKIVSFNEPHQFIKDDAILKTYSFTIKGSYANTLKLIYKLEQHGNYGKLISINFEKKKNYKRNRIFLECTILLQKIERNKDEFAQLK